MAGPSPYDFVKVSERKYAEYAFKLGLTSLGAHLIFQGKQVGNRTNRSVYVDPHTYKAVFGRFPHGYFPGSRIV